MKQKDSEEFILSIRLMKEIKPTNHKSSITEYKMHYIKSFLIFKRVVIILKNTVTPIKNQNLKTNKRYYKSVFI